MQRIIVSGIGTDVGKTVVSGILTLLLNGVYWKPIQCGDAEILSQWVERIHPPAYVLKAPLSPHHAARLENISIQPMFPPKIDRPLIIEGVGGVLVPLTTQTTTLDLFKSWNCQWVVVSRHYLGSINHTLLTIEVLKMHQIPILGIIFNGEANPETESAILEITQVPLLGRLLPEPEINLTTLKRYVEQWKPAFGALLQT